MEDCKPDYYSDIFPDDLVFNRNSRIRKAEKIRAIFDDFSNKDLNGMVCLDIGCSSGIMTDFFGKCFRKVIGADYDRKAVFIAKKNVSGSNVLFLISDAANIPFKDGCFDVVICNQIYEHVPDARMLVQEIYRVLNKDGFCFFGAKNRLSVMDDHYPLPFISLLPRRLANYYLRLFKEGIHYDIKLITYWGLRRLLRDFQLHDFSIKIIKNPRKYFAEDMVGQDSMISRLPWFILRMLYPFFPAYTLVLTKNLNECRR